MARLQALTRNGLGAVTGWLSVLAFLMGHQFDQRFRGTRLSVILTLAEPFIIIALTIAVRGLFHGRLPEYGSSIALFYSSGILPFYVFVRVSSRTRGVRYEATRRLPRVSSTDAIIASASTEAAFMGTMMTLWFLGMWFYGIDAAWPADILECLKPLFLFVILGIGIGLINSAISRQFVYWSLMYARVSRRLIFLSGAFYVVDLLPYFIRNVLVWNPLVHGIEWFRLGLYGRYPIHTLSKDYLIGWAVGTLFLGLVLHRATIRFRKF